MKSINKISKTCFPFSGKRNQAVTRHAVTLYPLEHFPALSPSTSLRCSPALPCAILQHFPALSPNTSLRCHPTLPCAVPQHFPALSSNTSLRCPSTLPVPVPADSYRFLRLEQRLRPTTESPKSDTHNPPLFRHSSPKTGEKVRQIFFYEDGDLENA